MLVTPVQVASMINTVVSGGFYRQPRLVQEICKSSGDTGHMLPYDPGQRVISSETAAKLCKLLEMAVEEGTGQEALVPVSRQCRKDRDRPGRRQQPICKRLVCRVRPRVNPPLCGGSLKRRGSRRQYGSSACFQGSHGGYPGAGLGKHNFGSLS